MSARKAPLALATLLLVLPSVASAEQWIGAFGAAPDRPQPSIATFEGWTLRTTVRLSTGGSKIRLRLSNDLNDAQMILGSARVALPGSRLGSIDPATNVVATFSGVTTARLPAHAAVLSDPIALAVPAMADLVVSIYVSVSTSGPTSHVQGLATTAAARGDQTGAEMLAGAGLFTTTERIMLSGVDVLEEEGGTIVAIGDSITDGTRSSPDANERWTDHLARRLQAYPALAHLGVVNAGISGNRLLRDLAGPSLLARLPRDAFSQPGLRYICVLIGINDISAVSRWNDPAQKTTAQELIEGYRQIIERGHEVGARVLIGTVIPFGGFPAYAPATEAMRQEINAWIRHGPGNDADGVLDFDDALRDPADPGRMLPAYDSGDHIHPNDAGYAAMAQSIDLEVFKR